MARCPRITGVFAFLDRDGRLVRFAVLLVLVDVLFAVDFLGRLPHFFSLVELGGLLSFVADAATN